MITGGKSGDAISSLLGRIPGLNKVLGSGGAGTGSGTSAAAGLGAAGAGSTVTGLLATRAPSLGVMQAGAGMPVTSGAGISAGGAMSNVLGKGVPIAGAITGGYGLLKNRGTRTNIINGAQTGSSIGTMILPGIGTGIGAGIGALAGWARGWGAPNQKELAARDVGGSVISNIASGATPAQRAEAAQAGGRH